MILTGHLLSAMPDSDFGDPEMRLFCMHDMLRFATFAGFFAIEKNSICVAKPYFDRAYVKYTYKHLLLWM